MKRQASLAAVGPASLWRAPRCSLFAPFSCSPSPYRGTFSSCSRSTLFHLQRHHHRPKSPPLPTGLLHQHKLLSASSHAAFPRCTQRFFSGSAASFYEKKESDDTKLRKILTARQDKVLREEIRSLERLYADLEAMEASQEDRDLLRRSIQHLEELFLLVVVGEYNSGKSSLLNAMLGYKYLAEGVTPTTTKIMSVKYGEKFSRHVPKDDPDREIVQVPVEWLKDLNLVDTPGTNAVFTSHQQITENFIPRSDLILFVTSVDRALSESEHKFLEHIRQWKKKVVVVLSKIDNLENEQELEQVKSFLSTGLNDLLSLKPKIFPVSSKQALKAKLRIAENKTEGNVDAKEEQERLWKSSRFAELESYILSTLDVGKRNKLKLRNPLGVAENLIAKYESALSERVKLVQKDVSTIQTIEAQLEEYKADMQKDFVFQHSRLDNVLLELSDRGDNFFEERLRLTNMLQIINPDKVKTSFERDVVGETAITIDRHVSEFIDWMVEKNSRQWKRVLHYAQQQASLHVNSGRMVGNVNVDFEYNRKKLLESIGSATKEVVNSYDKSKEAAKLSQQVQLALYSTAVVEAGAIGIGALITMSLFDVTGIMGVSALAATGLCILPFQRANLKRQFNERVLKLRKDLSKAMQNRFDKELEEHLSSIRDAISPYSRFVRTERERLDRLQERMQQSRANVRASSEAIQSAFGGGGDDEEENDDDGVDKEEH
ncbi:Mitofusin-2 [Balamuthia mandrillaris]